MKWYKSENISEHRLFDAVTMTAIAAATVTAKQTNWSQQPMTATSKLQQ